MVFWRRQGRVYGGIHIFVAPPSGGKSYLIGVIIRDIFLEGKRRIYSNSPYRTRDGKYCTYVWEPALMHENLYGQVIVIDEAHKHFWSRDFRNFSQEDKDWWSTTGHNEVTVYVLTQELARIDVIITDKATMIWDIEKVSIPLLDIPLYFRVTQWASKEAYQAASKGLLAKPPIAIKYYFFSQTIADMYDTHYFRSNFGEPYIGERWDERLKREGKPPLKPAYPTLVQRVDMEIDEKMGKVINVGRNTIGLMKKKTERIWREIGNRFDRDKEHLDPEEQNKVDESLFEDEHNEDI